MNKPISPPVRYREQDHASIVRALDGPEPVKTPVYQFSNGRTFSERTADPYRDFPKGESPD